MDFKNLRVDRLTTDRRPQADDLAVFLAPADSQPLSHAIPISTTPTPTPSRTPTAAPVPRPMTTPNK